MTGHNPYADYLALLVATQPQTLYLRDGELVVYRRPKTLHYQCRFKLSPDKWTRRSTGAASVEQAVANACLLYDEARFRHRLGLAQQAQDIAHIARIACGELRQEIDKRQRKSSYNDYVRIIERDFVAYFGERRIEELTRNDIKQFETWRDRRNQRTPTASTLNNYAAAWSRLVKTAVEHGYISESTPVVRLSTVGVKSKARPAFTEAEIEQMFAYMHEWKKTSPHANGVEMRHLLCDYIEILLYTGMRHGTEAMNLRWCDVEWHWHKGERYLRLWVSGKTGGRWLIAKHRALPALERLQQRHADLAAMSFDELLTSRVQKRLFRRVAGDVPKDFAGAFERLMLDTGLWKDTNGQRRTLYSLRHTYATLELLNGTTDIHTLSKQMGNSAAMIERHYSKLTATMAAERLA
jgi:integrase